MWDWVSLAGRCWLAMCGQELFQAGSNLWGQGLGLSSLPLKFAYVTFKELEGTEGGSFPFIQISSRHNFLFYAGEGPPIPFVFMSYSRLAQDRELSLRCQLRWKGWNSQQLSKWNLRKQGIFSALLFISFFLISRKKYPCILRGLCAQFI